MVRRVGFDNGAPKKGVADKVLDDFRAKSRAEKAAEAAEAKAKAERPRRQWFPIIFLTFWLTGWTGGIFLVIGIITSGQGDGGLFAWLSFAILGWVVAVFVLIKLIRNK
ncbi:MAG: hypothetical protein AAF393_12485 [Pseudomonadota bacterium]